MRRTTYDKGKALRNAIQDKMKVLWYHPDFGWRAVKGYDNVPYWATYTEEVEGLTLAF